MIPCDWRRQSWPMIRPKRISMANQETSQVESFLVADCRIARKRWLEGLRDLVLVEDLTVRSLQEPFPTFWKRCRHCRIAVWRFLRFDVMSIRRRILIDILLIRRHILIDIRRQRNIFQRFDVSIDFRLSCRQLKCRQLRCRQLRCRQLRCRLFGLFFSLPSVHGFSSRVYFGFRKTDQLSQTFGKQIWNWKKMLYSSDQKWAQGVPSSKILLKYCHPLPKFCS